MSRASYTTDPIEAAEDDIAGSKDLIASVADEINQHQRWLENYRVAEKERARRLKRQELMYLLELRRRRTVRSLRRFSLASLRLARRVASFLVRNGTALVVALGQLLVRCAAWTAPRARALEMVGRRLGLDLADGPGPRPRLGQGSARLRRGGFDRFLLDGRAVSVA